MPKQCSDMLPIRRGATMLCQVSNFSSRARDGCSWCFRGSGLPSNLRGVGPVRGKEKKHVGAPDLFPNCLLWKWCIISGSVFHASCFMLHASCLISSPG
ncbi:uncharacterized protein BO66DRAFT_110026 [Aspergillus aculeatinus CBS 121060]|uniref:Uncharacterized protein n=1 Tax=Aspergillus aculeatinus CBS 121060 TaxID=1448322 RepID=A0ACD1HLK1_9EURO|nr:hypothetical protein BO66DRAFT_110026 [Aspergillus aculeatinus CBS 121060]RAH74557.1 hypothetical protein BO66DRAFT_110026 [Aspergillus aculeatinus CBS 121060]